jgi:hypothetical protein
VDLSSMLLDDAVGDGETEASAATLALFGRALGGEKGIVDPLQMLGRDTGAIVRDGNADESVGLSGNAQGSAACHRVFRVEEEVEKDLLQFARIAQDRREIRFE